MQGIVTLAEVAWPYSQASTWAEPEVRQEALEVLRGLIARLAMRPQENGFEIELVGEIAHMVEAALGADSKKAAPLWEAAACSVKLVAGVGFEPTTFRL